MEKNRSSFRELLLRSKPVIFYLPALMAAGAFCLLWLEPAQDRGWQMLLVAAFFTLTIVLGIVRHSRTQTARRLNAALDAYVAREFAKERRWKAR